MKQDAAFARMDALIMADSIYAGYEGDPANKTVRKDLMSGFLRYAKEAAAGKETWIVRETIPAPDGVWEIDGIFKVPIESIGSIERVGSIGSGGPVGSAAIDRWIEP